MMSRFELLSEIYAQVTGVSVEIAQQTIANTETGRALKLNNSAYLYESTLSNINSILRELPASKRPKIDKRKLVHTVNHVTDFELSQPIECQIKSIPKLKRYYKAYLKKKDSIIRKQKAKNYLQVNAEKGRIWSSAD